MAGNIIERLFLPVVLILTALFVALNLYGSISGNEFWLFHGWNYTPLWYLILWACVTAGVSVYLWRFSDAVVSALESGRVRLSLLVGLFALIAAFHYDSFVFGGGNLRVAQIAQIDTIILSRYEYGTLALVGALFKLLSRVGLVANTAGVWSWRLYAFACSALAIWGAVKFASAITSSTVNRVAVTALILFSGPFLLLLGYIGVEPVIVPTVIWFSFCAYRLAVRWTLMHLVAVWGVVIMGILATVSSAFLVPAAACVTAGSALRSSKNWLIGGLLGMVVLLIAFILLYRYAGQSVGLAQYLVMPDGKLPLTAYSLRSVSNLVDKGLLVMAAAPIGLALLALLFRRLESPPDRVFAATIIVATICGRLVQVALDPINGMVLDFPRLTAYLAPFAIALAFYLDRRATERVISSRAMLLAAGLAVLLPLSLAPAFTKIAEVDPLARAFAERHDHFYRTTGLAFRDAYFYNRKLDEANAWERSLLIKSPDFLNMRGCDDLVANSRNSDALVSLYRLVARQPFWSEPRALLATLQIKLGHPQLAKPHLDTCLLLDPVAKQHLTNEYRYFQAIRQFDSALIKAERAETIHFRDKDIATDVMLIALQIGDAGKADSLAGAFLAGDTTWAYAHLVKGSLAERNQMIDSAVAEYRRFLRYAPPGNPDIDLIGKRLAQLRTIQNPTPGN
jgi:tetratricopeptide (TPR) repeat protein